MPLTVPDYIIVTTATGVPVAHLSPAADGLEDCWADSRLNGDSTLTFSLPLDRLEEVFSLAIPGVANSSPPASKWQYIGDRFRIRAAGREYALLKADAVEISRDGQALWGKVTAQESWTLLGKKYVTVSNDPANPDPPWGVVSILFGGTPFPGCVAGSAKSALSYLLEGTGWTVGEVEATGVRDLETEKETLLASVNKVQELWGGYLVWDSLNKVLHLRNETAWQNYTGFQVRYAKNLKHITRTADLDIVTRLYPFGENDLDIGSVNGGTLYLENFQYREDVLEGIYQDQSISDPQELKEKATEALEKLSRPRYNYKVGLVDLRVLPGYEHEDFALGDLVDVIDEPMGIQTRLRVIRHRYNVFQPWQCELEIGDPIETLTSMIEGGRAAAEFVENVKPNAGIRNILKGFLDNAATEINGSGGDYTCVDGVATWKERVDGQLTGKVLRISPKGLGISEDGGQTFLTAATGAGIAAGVIIGQLIAGGQLTITNEAGNFLVDSAGAQISDLTLTVTRADGKSKIIISPTDGIKIQKEGADKLYADTDGNLVAEELTAKKLKVTDGSDNVLIDAVSKIIDFSKFVTMLGQVTVNNVPLTQLIQQMNSSHQGELSGNVIDSLVANKISAGTITVAISLVAATITSDSILSVETDASVGNNISVGHAVILRTGAYTGGIKWGAESGAPAIYYDPGARSIVIGGGDVNSVYAKGQRIDQPPVAVFG